MTSDEARDRFDAAIDEDLGADERDAFDEALARDPVLSAEFERYQLLLAEARAVAREVPEVDLLGGVQEKLRARSGGRFYRDRFAERRGRSASVVLLVGLSICLVLLALSWFAYDAGLFVR